MPSAPATSRTTLQLTSLGCATVTATISVHRTSLSPSTTQAAISSSISLTSSPSLSCHPYESSASLIYFYTTIVLAFFMCILLALTITSWLYFKRRLAAAFQHRYRARFLPEQLAEPLAILQSINELSHPSSAPSTPSTLTPELPPRFDLEL